MSSEYKLANFLLNTYPRLLTYSAYKLYKSGRKPIVEKKIIKKVSDLILFHKVRLVLSKIKREGGTYLLQNNMFYQSLSNIINEEKLMVYANSVVDEKYVETCRILLAELVSKPDYNYGNKFEYLRVKLATL